MNNKGAIISVEWGYEVYSLTLTPRNWAHIKIGKPFKIRGKGYYSEGYFCWDYWEFGGGINGRLIVTYVYAKNEMGEGVGFEGNLSEAMIVEQ